MDTFKQQFITALKTARKRAHLTQAQLATRLSIARETVARWESGSQLPPLEMIDEIGTALSARMRFDIVTDDDTDFQ